MKLRKKARETPYLFLTTVIILIQLLVTSASASLALNSSGVTDCDDPQVYNNHYYLNCLKDTKRIASCKDRCGLIYNLPCSCDSQCVIYNNCCENMTYDCPEVLEEGKQKYGHLLGANIICTKDSFFMIDSCQPLPQTNSPDEKGHTTEEQETNDQGILQLLAKVPVTNIEDGITYRNSDTYFCFNNTNASLVPWDISFDLDYLQPPTDLKSLENIVSMTSVTYMPPERVGNLPRKCITSAVSQCLDSRVAQSQPELETQCKSFISYVETDKSKQNKVYTNRFCLECSEPKGTLFTHSDRDQYYRTDKLHFSVLVSLQAHGKIALEAKHPADNGLSDVITWHTASCDLTKSLQTSSTQLKESTGSSQGGACDIGACETGYEKHYDGQCKKLHVVGIGLADDDFPLTATDKEKWPFFMECALRKHVKSEAARMMLPANELFDNTLKKALYVVNFALYEPRNKILDKIFTTYRQWTLQLTYVVKAFREYRKTRALMSAAVSPTAFDPLENMVNILKTPPITSFNLTFLHGSGSSFISRGTRINNTTTTVCLRSPTDALGCWEDPSFANEERLISELTQSSCFTHLQDSNRGVGNLATGQTLNRQGSWKVWLLVSFGLVTALIL